MRHFGISNRSNFGGFLIDGEIEVTFFVTGFLKRAKAARLRGYVTNAFTCRVAFLEDRITIMGISRSS